MNKQQNGDITKILNQAYSGDEKAMNYLMPLVFDELKRIANQQRYSFKSMEKTLNTTALVNEAWIKINRSRSTFNDKKHFYSIAAIAMKQILLDQAKRKNSHKRQLNLKVTDFDLNKYEENHDESEWLIQLNHILQKLENLSPRLAELFQLKFFCDLTFEELAECFNISKKTAQRDWHKVKAIISKAMQYKTD